MQTISSLTVDPLNVLSDHSLLSWRLPLNQPPPITFNKEMRRWKNVDSDAFRAALLRSQLCDNTKRLVSADDFFQQYHDVLQRLAAQFAPVTKITIRRLIRYQRMSSRRSCRNYFCTPQPCAMRHCCRAAYRRVSAMLL